MIGPRDPPASADAVIAALRMPTNRPDVPIVSYRFPAVLREHAADCRLEGEFFVFDLKGGGARDGAQCPIPAEE
jgi:hypothetical protein